MSSPPLNWRVDVRDELILMTVNGVLDERGGSALCHALTQHLALEPAAILVDLSGMTVAEPGAVKAFAMLTEQAEVWPGTPLLFCTADPPTVELLRAASFGSVPVFGSVADGLATLRERDEFLSSSIPPATGAAHRARSIVREACERWGLPHLSAPAVLVVSELVTNAVEHARTAAALQLRLRPRYLYLAVFDGVRTEPVPRHNRDPEAVGGRGLHMVDVVATRWGHLPRPDGKVVWAAFATSPNA